MAQCEEQGFSGVTNEHFVSFLQKAEQFGIPGLAGQGNSGQASHSGVTIRWEFQPESNTLRVQCIESPMLLPCSFINNKIREAMSAAMGKAGLAGAPTAEQV